MNYNVIITEGGLPDDPACVHPFKANKLDDFKVAVGEPIARWRRYSPNRHFRKPAARCWLRARSSTVRYELWLMKGVEIAFSTLTATILACGLARRSSRARSVERDRGARGIYYQARPVRGSATDCPSPRAQCPDSRFAHPRRHPGRTQKRQDPARLIRGPVDQVRSGDKTDRSFVTPPGNDGWTEISA
jgi:hypothetical protein